MTTIPKHARLTKRVVEALPVPTAEQGDSVVWDLELVGFGVRCYRVAPEPTSYSAGPAPGAASA